jgi:hypothetical protein
MHIDEISLHSAPRLAIPYDSADVGGLEIGWLSVSVDPSHFYFLLFLGFVVVYRIYDTFKRCIS